MILTILNIIFMVVVYGTLISFALGLRRTRKAAEEYFKPKWGGEKCEDWMCRVWRIEMARLLLPHINNRSDFYSWGHLEELIKRAHPDWFRGPNKFLHYADLLDPVLIEIEKEEVDNVKPGLINNLNTLKRLMEDEHPDKIRFLTIDVYDLIHAINTARQIEEKQRTLLEYEKRSSINYYHGIHQLYLRAYLTKH